MKSWYRIEAKGSTAEILIYDEIGMFGISAKNFIGDLKSLGSVSAITLGINSPGGDVFDGIAIYNSLKRHPAKKTARVDGIAASIASVIAMAGDKIVMPDNAILMIHNPWGGVLGDAEDMRDFADTLDKIKIAILAAYRRSGKTDEELSVIMDSETWFTAEEAKAAGFADEVIESVKIAAFFDLTKYQKAPEALRRRPAAPAPASIRAEAERSATVEIITSCVQAGAPELAADCIKKQMTLDQVKALLADPEKVRGSQARWMSDELKEIHALCSKSGVPDLSERFINEGRPLAWVQDRLKESSSIRAICCASRLPTWEKRAGDYIRAGVSVEEARHNLFEVLLALDGGEIDNKLGPEGERAAGSTHNPPTIISTAEIYARRARRAGGADDLGRKLARVLSEHGQR